jgi:hypothetical protein
VPLDITSETVTSQNGMITLQGTGNPGDTIDIFVNGVGPKATAVVGANGIWTAGPFNPGTAASPITVKIVVHNDPTQEHVESIIVNPGPIIEMLNAQSAQAALSGGARRAKPIYAITIHRGTPPKPAKKPAAKKPAAKKPAAKKPAAKKPKPKK